VVLWTVLALYPNPLLLGRAVAQSWTPVIDPDAVRDIAATLPDDPRLIEEAVLTTVVPYGVPWEVYAVPWYFPTPAEVLAMGRGDCQGRAVVLASLLKAKGIPFTLSASFDHIWVDYPGKNPTPIENPRVAIAQKAPDEQYWFRLPADWVLKRSWDIEWDYFVAPAPGWRLLILVLGWVLILQRRRVLAFLRRRMGQPAVSEVRPL
jgi:hypothetical protein